MNFETWNLTVHWLDWKVNFAYVQIPLRRPDQTLSETRVTDQGLRQKSICWVRRSLTSLWTLCGRVRPGPVRVCIVEFHTDQTLSETWSQAGTCLDGSDSDRTRPGKVCGLVGDPSGPWVWSGRVRVVEFWNDPTRPDQRLSLAGPV